MKFAQTKICAVLDFIKYFEIPKIIKYGKIIVKLGGAVSLYLNHRIEPGHCQKVLCRYLNHPVNSAGVPTLDNLQQMFSGDVILL